VLAAALADATSAAVGSLSGSTMPFILLPVATLISWGSGNGVNAVTTGRASGGHIAAGSGRLWATTLTT